jgi:hypothetical protein
VIRLTLAILLLFSGVSPAAQPDPGPCGKERWPVKTLSDQDRGRVDLRPVPATIRELIAIKIHEIPYPDNARMGPEELRTYRIKGRLVEVRHEGDQDLHLILADPDDTSVTMVVEIPAVECVRQSGHKRELTAARAAVKALHPPVLVEVTGVGFFDFIHHPPVHGGAKNGFELHPVLSIKAN